MNKLSNQDHAKSEYTRNKKSSVWSRCSFTEMSNKSISAPFALSEVNIESGLDLV